MLRSANFCISPVRSHGKSRSQEVLTSHHLSVRRNLRLKTLTLTLGGRNFKMLRSENFCFSHVRSHGKSRSQEVSLTSHHFSVRRNLRLKTLTLTLGGRNFKMLRSENFGISPVRSHGKSRSQEVLTSHHLSVRRNLRLKTLTLTLGGRNFKTLRSANFCISPVRSHGKSRS